eukprot:jgi/Chrzof1/8701/Cz03g21060.t1
MDLLEKYVPGAQAKVKTLVEKAKTYAMSMNMTELEIKVMEATNSEPWGPHGSVMSEIAQGAYKPDGFRQIMAIVDQRLMETEDNWRLVYKALLLLEYLCKQGPMRVVEYLQSMEISRLERLRDRFDYKDPAGRDQVTVQDRQMLSCKKYHDKFLPLN